MRVITGSARGMRLKSPEGQEIRPTSEMVKEAVFSILTNEVPGAAVLDLFSGSGQLGIEALSRGARLCVFVDSGKQSSQIVRENLKSTRLEGSARLVVSDYAQYLRSATERFDIALLDPPYQKGILDVALPLTAAVMQDNGVILCETDRKESLPTAAGEFVLFKEYRYGKTKITAYRRIPEEDA